MPVRAKSIYEQAEPGDGLRVLTTNYWPRGVSKERVGVYKRILGPTRDLLHAFKSGEVAWPEYERQYLELMRGEEQQQAIRELAERARHGTVTVMCVCKDDAECHRRLLRDLVEREIPA
ncbi:MAG TPA: DUF488 family protein [Dehalococcoidia bacterium]|nr:DUF488 family protein [Dehalococcoidia bacterium]